MTKTTIIALLIGFGAGWSAGQAGKPPHNQYRHFDVGLYGGSITTSRLADIWGFENDFGACQEIAAGLNHVAALPQTQRAEFLKTSGHAFCQTSR